MWHISDALINIQTNHQLLSRNAVAYDKTTFARILFKTSLCNVREALSHPSFCFMTKG